MNHRKYATTILSLALVASCVPVPDNVDAWLEVPDSVATGEEFEFEAHIRNASERSVALYSLDIGDTFLSGIEIIGTEPPFSESTHIPIDNTVEFLFETTIQSETEFVVVLRALAGREGLHQGDFDFCINSAVFCDFQTISVEVVKSGE